MDLRDFRCVQCGKLLMRAQLVDSMVEIKCRRCGRINAFEGMSSGLLICMKEDCPNRIPAPVR